MLYLLSSELKLTYEILDSLIWTQRYTTYTITAVSYHHHHPRRYHYTVTVLLYIEGYCVERRCSERRFRLRVGTSYLSFSTRSILCKQWRNIYRTRIGQINLKHCLSNILPNATMYGNRPVDWRIYLALTIKLPALLDIVTKPSCNLSCLRGWRWRWRDGVVRSEAGVVQSL